MVEPVDGNVLRDAMRRVPSPVTVVTAVHNGEVRGITIGSFTSASLDPPLISFNVSRDAQAYPVLIEAERFIVHVLNDEQAYLSNHFAIPDLPSEVQFRDVSYELDSFGTPILSGVMAVLSCRRRAIYDAGDHVILLGEVYQLTCAREGGPMVYYNRGYHEIGDEADVALFEPAQGSSVQDHGRPQ